MTKIISAGGVYTYAYSTYLGGGSDLESGGDIAVDGAGNIYVTGVTWSDDFPTYNEIQTDLVYADAFVTKIISASGVYTYAYSTYLGGNDIDEGYGITVDSTGSAYVIGWTDSTDFPIHNEIQPDQLYVDAFVTKIISTNGVYTYGYSTYLGGNGGDAGLGIALDSSGNVYVAGVTGSDDFPTRNEIQADLVSSDAFVTKILSTVPNEPTVQFSQAVYTDNENIGPSEVVILNRFGDLSAVSQVQVSLSGGTASVGDDYNATGFPLTLSFNSGVTSQTVPITLVDDTLVEPMETISLTVSALSNTVIGPQSIAVLQIQDNDPAQVPSEIYLPVILK